MPPSPSLLSLPKGLSRRKRVLGLGLVTAAYFLAHEIAFVFPDAEKVLMAFWPAGGIGLAALLLSSRRAWPAILIAIFVAGNTANLLSGRPLANSLGFMTANVIESLASAWVLRRWCGDDIRFQRTKEVAALIFVATVVNAGSASLGALTASLSGAATFGEFWVSWWVADGLGMLIAAPFLTAWLAPVEPMRHIPWSRKFEGGVFLAVWIFFAQASFTNHDTLLAPHPYMLPVLLSWPALRLGQRSVTLALVILVALSVVSEAVVVGPILWSGHAPVERLLALQMFLAFCAVAGFMLTTSASEARAAERASREGHERLRALGDNLPNGMVYQVLRDFDGQMRFAYVSAGCEALNGVLAEDVLRDASTLYRLVVEEDRDRLAEAELVSARDMSLFNLDARFRRPDGEIRWMHLASSPRRLPDGRVLWDGIEVDITERRRSEDVLRDAQRLESVGILAGGIAHDFNNLLAIIVGNLSLVQAEQRPGAPEQIALDKASEACARAAELSHRLLTFAKGGNPVRVATRLGPLIVDTIKLALSGSNVSAAFDLPDDLPSAEVDDGQMRQVFSNLAINARDAMPNGGTLRVSGSVRVVGKDEVAGLVPGRYHRIQVQDEGRGIPAEIIRRVFEPYFTTKEKGTQKGQGLGLTICHSIITKHGGAITVTSNPGEGTTFTLHLPVSDATPVSISRFDLPSKISVQKQARKILVLDDEPDMLTMVEHLLRRFGHDVVTTASSHAALAAYRQSRAEGERPFDLVILDLTLQGGAGGVSTFEELRKMNGDVKAIVTTGYADDPAIHNYRRYGFQAALSKPFSIAALKAAIEATR
jgi:PAS domain S-box-containing protein